MGAFLDLENHAKVDGEAPAILDPGHDSLSYSGLRERVAALRDKLRGAGFVPGQAIAIVLPDGVDLLVATLAATALGGCTPLDPAGSEQELQSYLAHLRAPAMVTSEAGSSIAFRTAHARGMNVVDLSSGRVSAGIGEPDPRETAAYVLMFTSSTTGRPKLVPLTLANVEFSCRSEARVLELTNQDRLLNMTPMFNMRGLRTALAQLDQGGTVICVPRFDPDRFPQWLKEFEPTWISIPAAGLAALCSLSRRFPEMWSAGKLRFIRTGGTAPDQRLVRDLEDLSLVPVLDGYGTTETGCVTRSTIGSRKKGSVGKSTGTEIAILDGEIAVRGPNVTAGYLDDDEANRRAFRDGWFLTRDLGYLDEDGFLFLTGRIDETINRGGQKVLPQEVEHVLRDHPTVRDVAVFGVPHKTLGAEVVAAVVLRSKVTAIELRRFASGRLASYKIPQSILFVDDLPRNPAGKLDRKSLVDAYSEVTSRERRNFEAAASETERIIATMWEEELRQVPVGRDSDFFRLGGDSLTGALIGSRIQSAFGVGLDLRAFAEHPKLRDLAEMVDELRRGGKSELEVIEYASRSEPLPLSFAQERTWKYCQNSLSYNVGFAHLLRGPLDVESLRKSILHVAGSHEILRTTCVLSDDGLVQRVHSTAGCELSVTDVSGFAEPEREVRRILEEEVVRPFDLSRGPLIRFVLARTGPDEHWLLRSNHHIISDAHSLKIYFRHLGHAYEDFQLGRIPEPCLQRLEYGDYALWQRREWARERSAVGREVDWWADRVSRIPRTEPIPICEIVNQMLSSSPLRKGPLAANEGLQLWGIDLATASRLSRLQSEEGVNFFAIRLAVFAALVADMTGQPELVVGTHFSFRNRMEWQEVFGDFTNLVALLLSTNSALSFRESVRAIHQQVKQFQAHGEIPYELLCEELRARGITPPAIEVMFHTVHQTDAVQMGDVEMTWLSRVTPTMPWGFTMFVDRHNEDRLCSAMFDAHLYEPDAVRLFIARFQRLLDAASLDPDAGLEKLLAASRLETKAVGRSA